MKKLGYIIISFALVLSSCLKEEGPGRDNGDPIIPEGETSEELVEKIITVTAPQTRTSLNGTDVVWTDGDQIAVWDGYACRKFVMTGAPKGNKAEFRGFVRHDSPKQGTKYYALYPYSETFITEIPPTSADDVTQTVGYARMLFPFDSEQTAVPGNFDKDAAYAIAESDDLENMTFNQRTSLLRFSLADDMDDVVSVKISGNESNDYIWGTMSMRFVEGGLLYPGVVNNSAVNPDGRGKEIILRNDDNSPLDTGVDYYIVIPSTLFGRGYKLTFVHEDGTTSSRSSAKSIEYNTTRIYDLAPGPITKSMLARYSEDYTANGTLNITGHGTSRQYFGEPIIIKSNETYTITTGGAYFIEPGSQVTINITSATKHILIVGDCKSEMSVVSLERSILMQEWGNLIVLNMDFIFKDFGDNVISNNSNIDNLSHIAFEDCCLRYDSPKSILHSQRTSVEHIRFYDNDIIFSYDKILQDIFMFSTDSATDPVYGTFIFRNNLLYHKGNFNSDSQSFALTRGDGKTLSEVSLAFNTFINLKTRTDCPYYIGGNATKIYAHNNLFYLPNQGSGTGRLFSKSYEPLSDENATYRVRRYGVSVFKPADKVFKFSSHATEGTYVLDSDPFTSIDVTNGVFKKGDPLYPESNQEIGAKQDKETGKRIREV